MLDKQFPVTFIRPRRVAEHGPEPGQIRFDGRANLDDGHAESSRGLIFCDARIDYTTP